MGVKAKYKEKSSGMLAILKVVKSLFVSLITTFAGIINFAFVLKWATLDEGIITPVNLAIKAISVLLGVLVLNKNSGKKLLNGVLFAGLYTMISFTIFSCLAGTFVLGFGLVLDFGFNMIVGVLASILSAAKGR